MKQNKKVDNQSNASPSLDKSSHHGKDIHIHELAKYLTVNVISHAVDDETRIEEVAEKQLDIRFKNIHNYTRTRNILIVGAGVSFNANNKILTARQFIDHIKACFSENGQQKQIVSTVYELLRRYILSGKLKKGQEKSKVRESDESIIRDRDKWIEQIKAAVSEVRQEENQDYGDQQLENQLHYLEMVTGLKRDEFETVMYACSKINNQKVLEELKMTYDLKHVPNLAYEIIGHLFKHRFLDVVIDFNFDEILSDVVQQEMRHMDYENIVSDGDLKTNLSNLMLNHRLKKPIYIKPHGTVSHPSSLRFNKEHYYTLPANISGLLEYLLQAQYERKNADKSGNPIKDKNLRLNIIVAGFGMQSSELNLILRNAFDKHRSEGDGISFFILNTMEEEAYRQNMDTTSLLPPNLIVKSADEKLVKEEVPIHYIQVDRQDGDNYSLENIFLKLWQEIEKNFRVEDQLLRNISRHLIIKAFFQKKDISPIKIFKEPEELEERNRYKSLKYLYARIYVELAILFANCDGIINITQIRESRVGNYYMLLERALFLVNKSIDLDLFPFIKSFGFGFYKDFVKDTFTYKGYKQGDYIQELVSSLLSSLETIDRQLSEYHIRKETDQNPVNTVTRPEAEELFEGLLKNPSWEVKPNFDEYKISRFQNVKDQNLLHTDFRFNLQRLSFFKRCESGSWNVLLSITKKASFLKEDKEISRIIGNRNIKVCLLLAKTEDKAIDKTLDDDSCIDRAQCIFHKEDGENFRKLPWWLHNQHLHIFLKFKTGATASFTSKGEATSFEAANDLLNQHYIDDYVGGIYYQRRLLSRKVNPIFFEREQIENVKELIDIFVNYWVRGGFYRGLKEETNQSIQNQKQFLANKEELFNLIQEKVR